MQACLRRLYCMHVHKKLPTCLSLFEPSLEAYSKFPEWWQRSFEYAYSEPPEGPCTETLLSQPSLTHLNGCNLQQWSQRSFKCGRGFEYSPSRLPCQSTRKLHRERTQYARSFTFRCKYKSMVLATESKTSLKKSVNPCHGLLRA